MALTLNQVVRRIKIISLAHQQIASFVFGRPSDFLNAHQTLYAAAFLQDVPGSIDISGKTLTMSFKLFLLDLVNVSENTKENELDVLSDMLQIAGDLMAQMDHSSYTDWKVTLNNPFTMVVEKFDDMTAGVVVDFSVQVPYEKDVCVVPNEEDVVEGIHTLEFNNVFN